MWAKSAVDVIGRKGAELGLKALTSGSIDVPQMIMPRITKLPENPVRLIDVLVNRERLSEGNTFEFMRQTVRTNNATAVADGATKPTSIFTVEPVEDRARVIAHLSEPIPERYLQDQRAFTDFMQSEMFMGVLDGLEDQVINGDGTGENITGIYNTSGVTLQPWSTSILETMRKARTRMQNLHEAPTAWALNPDDFETLDLVQDGAGAYIANEGTAHITGNLPMVTSTSVPTGTAVLADWRQVQIRTREDMRLDADRAGDLFDANQFKLRAEGRYGLAVLRPRAVCLVTMTGS